MDRLIDLTILALAVWRFSSMLVYEEGPWEIFSKLRQGVGVKYDEYSNPYGESTVGKLFTCVWCMSVWVSSAVVISYLVIPETTVRLSTIFAISASAILVDTIIGGRE